MNREMPRKQQSALGSISGGRSFAEQMYLSGASLGVTQTKAKEDWRCVSARRRTL